MAEATTSAAAMDDVVSAGVSFLPEVNELLCFIQRRYA